MPNKNKKRKQKKLKYWKAHAAALANGDNRERNYQNEQFPEQGVDYAGPSSAEVWSQYESAFKCRTVLEFALLSLIVPQTEPARARMPTPSPNQVPPAQKGGWERLMNPVQDLGRSLLNFLVGGTNSGNASQQRQPPADTSASSQGRQRPLGHPANPSTHSTPVILRRRPSSPVKLEQPDEGASTSPAPVTARRRKNKNSSSVTRAESCSSHVQSSPINLPILKKVELTPSCSYSSSVGTSSLSLLPVNKTGPSSLAARKAFFATPQAVKRQLPSCSVNTCETSQTTAAIGQRRFEMGNQNTATSQKHHLVTPEVRHRRSRSRSPQVVMSSRDAAMPDRLSKLVASSSEEAFFTATSTTPRASILVETKPRDEVTKTSPSSCDGVVLTDVVKSVISTSTVCSDARVVDTRGENASGPKSSENVSKTAANDFFNQNETSTAQCAAQVKIFENENKVFEKTEKDVLDCYGDDVDDEKSKERKSSTLTSSGDVTAQVNIEESTSAQKSQVMFYRCRENDELPIADVAVEVQLPIKEDVEKLNRESESEEFLIRNVDAKNDEQSENDLIKIEAEFEPIFSEIIDPEIDYTLSETVVVLNDESAVHDLSGLDDLSAVDDLSAADDLSALEDEVAANDVSPRPPALKDDEAASEMDGEQASESNQLLEAVEAAKVSCEVVKEDETCQNVDEPDPKMAEDIGKDESPPLEVMASSEAPEVAGVEEDPMPATEQHSEATLYQRLETGTKDSGCQMLNETEIDKSESDVKDHNEEEAVMKRVNEQSVEDVVKADVDGQDQANLDDEVVTPEIVSNIDVVENVIKEQDRPETNPECCSIPDVETDDLVEPDIAQPEEQQDQRVATVDLDKLDDLAVQELEEHPSQDDSEVVDGDVKVEPELSPQSGDQPIEEGDELKIQDEPEATPPSGDLQLQGKPSKCAHVMDEDLLQSQDQAVEGDSTLDGKVKEEGKPEAIALQTGEEPVQEKAAVKDLDESKNGEVFDLMDDSAKTVFPSESENSVGNDDLMMNAKLEDANEGVFAETMTTTELEEVVEKSRKYFERNCENDVSGVKEVFADDVDANKLENLSLVSTDQSVENFVSQISTDQKKQIVSEALTETKEQNVDCKHENVSESVNTDGQVDHETKSEATSGPARFVPPPPPPPPPPGFLPCLEVVAKKPGKQSGDGARKMNQAEQV